MIPLPEDPVQLVEVLGQVRMPEFFAARELLRSATKAQLVETATVQQTVTSGDVDSEVGGFPEPFDTARS